MWEGNTCPRVILHSYTTLRQQQKNADSSDKHWSHLTFNSCQIHGVYVLQICRPHTQSYNDIELISKAGQHTTANQQIIGQLSCISNQRLTPGWRPCLRDYATQGAISYNEKGKIRESDRRHFNTEISLMKHGWQHMTCKYTGEETMHSQWQPWSGMQKPRIIHKLYKIWSTDQGDRQRKQQVDITGDRH